MVLTKGDYEEYPLVDMDNVLVDFPSGIAQLDPTTLSLVDGRLDEIPGIFA